MHRFEARLLVVMGVVMGDVGDVAGLQVGALQPQMVDAKPAGKTVEQVLMNLLAVAEWHTIAAVALGTALLLLLLSMRAPLLLAPWLLALGRPLGRLLLPSHGQSRRHY